MHPCMGFWKPTKLKGYTLKTLGRNISQNQASDEEILPFFFPKNFANFSFFNQKNCYVSTHCSNKYPRYKKIFNKPNVFILGNHNNLVQAN
jgi:hypothetical protein